MDPFCLPTTIKVNWNPFLTFFLRPMRYWDEIVGMCVFASEHGLEQMKNWDNESRKVDAGRGLLREPLRFNLRE